MFKGNNKDTKRRPKLTIKIPEWREWRHSGVFIVNFGRHSDVIIVKFEHISHLVLVFL